MPRPPLVVQQPYSGFAASPTSSEATGRYTASDVTSGVAEYQGTGSSSTVVCHTGEPSRASMAYMPVMRSL